MAPKARIAVYKVCWLSGRYAKSDVHAAIDQAVINLPVFEFAYCPVPSGEPRNRGFRGSEHGVFVACAGGNEGASLLAGTVANVAPWVMTVLASAEDRTFPANVELGDGQILSGLSLHQLGGGQVAPLITGTNATAGDAAASALCMPESLNPALVTGKVVRRDREGTSLLEKGATVLAAGGAGMIIRNTADHAELHTWATPPGVPSRLT